MAQARIIAEIGINHNGSEATARALIEAAAKAGAWGIKFQYRNLANAYANDARQIGDEMLQKEIRRNYLPPEIIVGLSRHAQTQGVRPGISFFTPDDIGDFGEHIGIFEFFKIPSVEFTNLALIKRIEAFGKYGLISTGAYTEAAIERVLQQLDSKRWVPLHCVSNYPVGIPNSKLGYIAHLRGLWGADVGYSSHDEYWETCLLALQLGASVIERHITFDKTGDGLDHSSSSMPDEFAKLVRFAENMNMILAGNGPRVPNQGELLNLQNLGRSFYASGEIAAGEAVTGDKVVLRAPRTGLGQEEIGDFLGQAAVRPIKTGTVIDRSVFEKPITLPPNAIDFARAKKLSLPVRFHDLAHIEARIPLGNYEFHLSFGDVERPIDTTTLKSSNRYSVHLPDYVSPTQLMDPFSPAVEQRQASLRVLDRTVAFAKALQDRTGAETPVVGSFSVVHTTLEDFFKQHAALIETYRAQGVTILPQWLPPIAWYFGGAVRLEAMNNVADAAYIKAMNLPICMDICHLCMGDKVFDFKAADVVRDLAAQTRHIHIADARGHDGEGVAFGEGDPENRAAIAAAMAMDCVKVIEVWQGHLHGGAGFVKAIMALKELFPVSKQRTALILGVTGQDGSLLAQKLVREGWRVRGTFRRGEATKLWRLQEMELTGNVELINLNLHEPFQVVEAISSAKPDHIYHFAGESFVADSYQQPRLMLETNLLGTLNVLESMRLIAPEARLFFSSSSEVFGVPTGDVLLDENSSFRPTNPYAISKLSAQQLVGTYRERHKIHAVCGLMFNHESPMRARNFVTRKITYHIARLAVEGGAPMSLGAMESCRDWGSAQDYVDALPDALDYAPPQDYVFATGRKTAVKDFLRLAAAAAGFQPTFDGEGAAMTCRDAKTGQILAVVSAQYFRPFDTPPLLGNPARLKAATAFKGSRDVAAIAEEMVKTDIQRRKRGSTHV